MPNSIVDQYSIKAKLSRLLRELIFSYYSQNHDGPNETINRIILLTESQLAESRLSEFQLGESWLGE